MHNGGSQEVDVGGRLLHDADTLRPFGHIGIGEGLTGRRKDEMSQ